MTTRETDRIRLEAICAADALWRTQYDEPRAGAYMKLIANEATRFANLIDDITILEQSSLMAGRA